MIVTPSVKTIPPMNDAASKPEWGVHGSGETVLPVEYVELNMSVEYVAVVKVDVGVNVVFVWFVDSLVGVGGGVDVDVGVVSVVDGVVSVAIGDADVMAVLLMGADTVDTIKKR